MTERDHINRYEQALDCIQDLGKMYDDLKKHPDTALVDWLEENNDRTGFAILNDGQWDWIFVTEIRDTISAPTLRELFRKVRDS